MVNRDHTVILAEVKRRSRKTAYGDFNINGYLGTKKPCLGLSAADKMTIARGWLIKNPEATPERFQKLLDSLFYSKSNDEFHIGGVLLKKAHRLRRQLCPESIYVWLKNAQGWSEVDCICQGAFPANELLDDWQVWEDLLNKMAVDRNIHRRRASLVVLTRAVRESNDLRLSRIAYANLNLLKGEKDILITKAVSWLLRELVKHHRASVEKYLVDNADSLPKIALRETRKKMLTGKKTGGVN